MKKMYTIENLELPLLALRGIWIMPGMSISFDVGRDISKAAIEQASERDNQIFLVSQKNPLDEDFEVDDLFSMGVVAKIRQSVKLNDGSLRVIVDGISRASLLKVDKQKTFLMAEVENYVYVNDESSTEIEAIKRIATDSLRYLMEYKKDIPDEAFIGLSLIDDDSAYADTLMTYINPNPEEIQNILEELDIFERFKYINKTINEELEINKIRAEINSKVNSRLNESQKEYFIREQIQVLKEELNDKDGSGQSYEDKYREEIKQLSIKEEHKEHLLKELSRLENINSASPESNVIRTYLENVLEIPFGKYTEDEISIEKSRDILNKDHHGLDDVKERILEFLAVRKLKGDLKGSILCLVGPPGVGKTSIVKSVAESMNREYVSMRLGGVSDESEIRGHRKTYIGAMPGRIISSLQRADTLNPVFLLDEIDKLSSDYRADPSSAMLEVLDPNQNDEFVDRYIEIPVDLSNVMFVTTANTTSTIPRALLDRMEVIEVSGYTEYDKLVIAKKYLLPKQLEQHGLKTSQVTVSDAVIKKIIKNYTRESGVRNLERELAKIARKSAMKIIEGQDKLNISVKNYTEYLGREKILDDEIVKTPQVGLVTGLAWTQVGGELLQIEVNTMKGKGKIQLTGSLGDVMKESAMAAFSYIKSRQESFGIDSSIFDETDIHIHAPEGATPKDGPSAGITMTTGIVSALTGAKIRQDVAMTGEVTIRGRVLAIGGLKEKALAALRYGIKNIIIPKQNEKDLDDIPEDAKKELKFYPVSHVDEVLEIALIKGEENENK